MNSFYRYKRFTHHATKIFLSFVGYTTLINTLKRVITGARGHQWAYLETDTDEKSVGMVHSRMFAANEKSIYCFGKQN